MSKATKRKYVTKEVLYDYVIPEGSQKIVKIIGGRGNNLHEVQSANGDNYLVSMPSKFRKNVWIKKGDYVIVHPIEEGDKVKAEIISILYKEQIKNIKREGLWPDQFKDSPTIDDIVEKTQDLNLNIYSNEKHSDDVDELNGELSDSEEETSDDDLFVNTNRCHQPGYFCSSESDESSSDEN